MDASGANTRLEVSLYVAADGSALVLPAREVSPQYRTAGADETAALLLALAERAAAEARDRRGAGRFIAGSR
jgi:hypothetical protein